MLSALVMRFEWEGLEAEAVCFGDQRQGGEEELRVTPT